jgi:glutamyl/glutaminyl-tRNA synthetase
MHVFINDRALGPVAAEGATVGDILEAIGVHVDPSEIVTAVELDGVGYSAGEEERFTRRAAAGVDRLVVSTQTPAAFAVAMREEIAAALHIIAAKVAQVVALFDQHDERGANRLLAALLEELRLVLVLDQQLGMLDGRAAVTPIDDIRELAPMLLRAQEARAWPELRDLLGARVAPLLESWSRQPGV